MLAVDLDRFKEVDDELGRERADGALCEVGRRVAEAIAPADTVARFGGDEFMLVRRPKCMTSRRCHRTPSGS